VAPIIPPEPEPEPERIPLGDLELVPSRDPDAEPVDPDEVYADEDDDWDPEPRVWEDMPYAPTAARKSAVQRGNDVLVRPFRQPVYTVAAAGRFATSLLGARDVVQPFGFGVGAQLRIHFLRLFKARVGVEVYAGFTQFTERVDYLAVEGSAATITRRNRLGHTDVSAGPSMQIPIGPLFLQFGGSAGVGFSTLARTRSIDAIDDEIVASADFLLRGGASVGIPILNRHGLTIGAGVQHIFSREEVVEDPERLDSPLVQPFGTLLEINLGYQMWF